MSIKSYLSDASSNDCHVLFLNIDLASNVQLNVD